MSDILSEGLAAAAVEHQFRFSPRPGLVRDLCDALERLQKERDEARAFIIAEYNEFHDSHPYAHELRARYPWLAESAEKEEK